MEQAMELISKRDTMEGELRRLKQILIQNNANMDDSLVDDDGYPRSDIDIYTIRKVRHDIICLQNDLRAVMEEIEHALHNIHGSAFAGGSGGDQSREPDTNSQSNVDSSTCKSVKTTEPVSSLRTSNDVFLRAEDISPDSPAALAGLFNGDQIVQFGSLCASNFSNVQQVAEIVRNSIGVPLRVTVLRELHAVRLTLVPKEWMGNGLLGCRVVPLKRS